MLCLLGMFLGLSASIPNRKDNTVKRRTALKRPLAIALALALAATPVPIRAIAAEDATTTVEVNSNTATGDLNVVVGNITVGDNEYGAVVQAQDGTTAELTVEGDITSGYEGILASAKNGTVDVTVSGNVTSTDDDGVSAYAYEDGKTTVTVSGNVTSTDDDGVNAYAYEDGTTTVTVNGDVTSYDDAIILDAWDTGSATVNVNGEIDAGYYGISADASDTAEVNATVVGNITAGEEAIEAEAGDEGIVNINVTGDVTSTRNDAIYVDTYNNAIVNVSVVGDVSSEDEYSYGVYTDTGSAGTTNLQILGDLTAEFGDGAVLTSYGEQSLINLFVDGNITGGHEGLYSCITQEGAGISAVVTGTLSGGDIPVALQASNEYSTAPFSDNLDLTVWQIVPVDGVIAADVEQYAWNYGDRTATYTQNEDFEATIKYIIKVEQPEAGATLTATDADGAALATSHGYDVALEGEKVLLKVELEPGYKLTGAFNGDGEKTALLQDADGNWYVEVPKGGGVYLSVELEKEKYQAVFVNEDGTVLQTVEYEYGETPAYTGETPTKAATDTATYTFSGWTVTTDPETGAVTYTATFTETAKPAPEPTNPDEPAKPEPANGPAKPEPTTPNEPSKSEPTNEPAKPEPTNTNEPAKPEPTTPEAQPEAEPASPAPAAAGGPAANNAPAAAGGPAAGASIPKTGDATNAFAPLALAGAGLALVALRRKARQE